MSELTDTLRVRGVLVSCYRVLRCDSPAVPNAIAALLLHHAWAAMPRHVGLAAERQRTSVSSSPEAIQ